MAKQFKPGLSKSRLTAFRQCPKRLWLEDRKVEPIVYDAAAKARFATGHEVGELARELVGHGWLIEHQDDLGMAMAETDTWQCEQWDQPIFEGTFEREGVLVRVDALIPVRRRQRGGYSYRLCEVKSSASVKEYHYFDIALQAWVLEGQPLPIRLNQAELVVINTQFVYQGDGDFRGLFKSHVVDHAIKGELEQVPQVVSAARATLKGKMPKVAMGPQCTTPFECPFQAHCSKGQPAPPKFPVGLLPNSSVLADQLTEEGYTDLRKVPAARMESVKSARQRRVYEATVSGKPYLASDAADKLAKLAFPRHYLDFETIGFTVPRWEGTRPYEALPFQWSCHIETEPGKFIHKECLVDDGLDPVFWFASQLLEALEGKGVILMYSGYENRILREAATRLPKFAKKLKAVQARLFDLLPFTREHYYHPKMMGKWTMKNVLPAIAPELDYATLGEVRNGTDAQLAYMELIADETPKRRKRALRRDMLSYCERDTWAMVRLVQTLEGKRATKPPRPNLGKRDLSGPLEDDWLDDLLRGS